MKEACIGHNQPFIADDQAAEMAEPREGALHDPPPPVAPQLAAVLGRGPLMVGTGGNDRLDASASQSGSQRIAVIAPTGNQALRPFAWASGLSRAPNRDGVERPFEKRHFRRGRRLQVCSQRSTRAIDQNHPLCTLAAFRLPDLGPPFLAGMKLPSTKHSSQRIFWWSLSWATKARQSLRSMPLSSHCLSRRQQVLGLPYRRGSSLHWAPVQRIQRIPSKQRRSSTRGRPPWADRVGSGRCTRIASHCCLVSPRHAMARLLFFLGDSWRYDTSNPRF
jgi:hypothetical protein